MQAEEVSDNLAEGQTFLAGEGLEAINCLVVTKEGLFSSENKKTEAGARLPQKYVSATLQRKLILRENGNSFDGLRGEGFYLKMSETFQVPPTISGNHVIGHLQTPPHLGSYNFCLMI